MKRTSPGMSVAERIAYYSQPQSSGCVLWVGPLSADGYAAIRVEGRAKLVSRLLLGLSDRRVLACHRCDNPRCVNVAHLFAGSDADNARDRETKGRNANTKKTHCRRGHEFTPSNTYRWPRTGARHCRACRSARRGK